MLASSEQTIVKDNHILIVWMARHKSLIIKNRSESYPTPSHNCTGREEISRSVRGGQAYSHHNKPRTKNSTLSFSRMNSHLFLVCRTLPSSSISTLGTSHFAINQSTALFVPGKIRQLHTHLSLLGLHCGMCKNNGHPVTILDGIIGGIISTFDKEEIWRRKVFG